MILSRPVRSTSAAPTAEDFRSKGGTPIVVKTDTGALYVLLSDGTTILEAVGPTATVVGKLLTIKPASSETAIEVYYSSSSGKYQIGATNSATPALLFKNNGGSERMRLTDAGELLVGLTSANANGGCLQLKSGITFPATAVGASDANTLDDYEEGTWTPSDGSGAGLSFTSAGTYTKTGRMVVAQAAVIYPATASGANAVIGGFPFTIGASNAVAVCYITDPTGTTIAFGASGTTIAALVLGAGGAARTNAQLSTDTVAFTMVYEV